MTMEHARRYPILTIACGPTNSIRGASYLSRLDNAIVIDVGGTTTDLGVIQARLPPRIRRGGHHRRRAHQLPHARRHIPLAWAAAPSSARGADGTVTVGPDSVGYETHEKGAGALAGIR